MPKSRRAAAGQACPKLLDEARRLAELPEASRITADDPRFGPTLKRLDPTAASAAQLARRILLRVQDGSASSVDAADLRRLREEIEALAHLTIEEELSRIFAAEKRPRNCQIIAAYYGWGGGRPRTLAQIGEEYGMTRERVRQICSRQVGRRLPERIVAPVMDRTLASLRASVPRSADALERDLVERGWTSVGLSLDVVLHSARLLGREPSVALVRAESGSVAVAPDQEEMPGRILEAAKRDLYYRGLTTLRRLGRVVERRFGSRVDPRLIAEVVPWIDGFSWLDEEFGWFRSTSIFHHGLPRAIDKILSVAGTVSASQLRAAVGRNQRMWRVPPPKRVLLEFCRQTPDLEVEGRRVRGRRPKDWRDTLCPVERELVSVLLEHGPAMERNDLEERCVARGVNRFSFQAFLALSPIIEPFGHGVHGLLGARVSRRKLRALIRRPKTRPSSESLDSRGRPEDNP